jgi:hypothetical protein
MHYTTSGDSIVYDFIYYPTVFFIYLKVMLANFADAGPFWLNNRVFRIVVVPAQFFESAKIVNTSYENITMVFGITDNDFVK